MRLRNNFFAKVLLVYLVIGLSLLLLGYSFLPDYIRQFLIATLSLSFIGIPITGLIERGKHKHLQNIKLEKSIKRYLFYITLIIIFSGIVLYVIGLIPEGFYIDIY